MIRFHDSMCGFGNLRLSCISFPVLFVVSEGEISASEVSVGSTAFSDNLWRRALVSPWGCLNVLEWIYESSRLLGGLFGFLQCCHLTPSKY